MVKSSSIKYKVIQIIVLSKGATIAYVGKIVTDKYCNQVTGIYVNSIDPNAFINSIFGKINIGKKEIYPSNFGAIFLSGSIADEPLNRFDPIEESFSGSEIDILYTDGGGERVCYPYTLNVYLRLGKTIGI